MWCLPSTLSCDGQLIFCHSTSLLLRQHLSQRMDRSLRPTYEVYFIRRKLLINKKVTGIYISNECTKSHVVPVPCKMDVTPGVTIPADPKLFNFEAWVKQPNGPTGLVWERVTKETGRLIIHYMAGEWKQKEKTDMHTQYIGDILLLKVHRNVVVDATERDERDGLKYLDNIF